MKSPPMKLSHLQNEDFQQQSTCNVHHSTLVYSCLFQDYYKLLPSIQTLLDRNNKQNLHHTCIHRQIKKHISTLRIQHSKLVINKSPKRIRSEESFLINDLNVPLREIEFNPKKKPAKTELLLNSI